MIVMVVASVFASAQPIIENSNPSIWESINHPENEYIKDYSDKDTSFKYLFVFQNLEHAEYSLDIDRGGFSFATSDELKSFAKLLDEMVNSNENELIVKGEYYTLAHHKFAPYYIYVTDSEGKWTILTDTEIKMLNTQVANL